MPGERALFAGTALLAGGCWAERLCALACFAVPRDGCAGRATRDLRTLGAICAEFCVGYFVVARPVFVSCLAVERGTGARACFRELYSTCDG